MKFFVVFLVISCAVGFSECMTKEERVAAFVKIVKECATKEGASDADVDELLSHKSPSSRGGKCIQACFTEKVGFVKDNKVNKEGTAVIAKLAFDGDATKVQLFNDLAAECGDISDSDRCEAAFKIIECGHHGVKSKGMTFEDL